jgi:hypothetical protein
MSLFCPGCQLPAPLCPNVLVPHAKLSHMSPRPKNLRTNSSSSHRTDPVWDVGIRKDELGASNFSLSELIVFRCSIASGSIDPHQKSSQSITQSTVDLSTEREVCPDS